MMGAARLDETDVKLYCVRVSETLREYLTHGCDIPARDLATSELAQVLKQKQVPQNIARHILNVLRVCDKVKLANDVSDPFAIKALASIAQQIVLLYPSVFERTKKTFLISGL